MVEIPFNAETVTTQGCPTSGHPAFLNSHWDHIIDLVLPEASKSEDNKYKPFQPRSRKKPEVQQIGQVFLGSCDCSFITELGLRSGASRLN